MSKVQIKINGEKLTYFDSLTIERQINSIASTCSFMTFKDLSDYEYSDITILRDDIIIFGGVVVGKSVPNNIKPEPFTYNCYSSGGILMDCTIPLELYPLQSQGKTLEELVTNICDNFGVKIFIDSSAYSDCLLAYTLENNSPEQKVIDVINNLCAQRNIILSHENDGTILLTKNIIGSQQQPPRPISSTVNYDYTAFFYKYNIVGQQSITGDSAREASTTLDNINEKRTITKVQKDGENEDTIKQANSFKNDSYKANSQEIEYADYFPKIGGIYNIDGIKLLCNRYNYRYSAKEETCSLTLLNKKIYQR